MKNFLFPLMVIAFTILFNSCVSNTAAKTQTFKVWGNCDMCKKTIEGSLDVKGVSGAEWNVDSKMITVTFDTTQINLNKIQKRIAAVGYDNDGYRGDDKAYNALHECCWYKRK